MGWDYYTYEKQPYWFLQEIALIMNYETQTSKAKDKLDRIKSPRKTSGLRR